MIQAYSSKSSGDQWKYPIPTGKEQATGSIGNGNQLSSKLQNPIQTHKQPLFNIQQRWTDQEYNQILSNEYQRPTSYGKYPTRKPRKCQRYMRTKLSKNGAIS